MDDMTHGYAIGYAAGQRAEADRYLKKRRLHVAMALWWSMPERTGSDFNSLPAGTRNALLRMADVALDDIDDWTRP